MLTKKIVVDLLLRTTVGCNFYEPETKNQRKQQKHSRSPTSKMAKTCHAHRLLELPWINIQRLPSSWPSYKLHTLKVSSRNYEKN